MEKVKIHLKIGFSFGLTSGVITTLGLIVGLNSAIQSKMAVIGGVLTIAKQMPFQTPWAFICLKKRKINIHKKKFGLQLSQPLSSSFYLH